MTDPVILFVKPKAISAHDKKALSSADVIVVEVDDPQSVKLTRATAEVSSTDMLMAAMKAIHDQNDTGTRTAFFKNLYNVLLTQHQSQ